MHRILLPGLLVVLLVMSLVGLGGWNRTAEPRQVIELTERELSLPVDLANADRRGAAFSLQLVYEGRAEPLEARNWLSEDRLRAIGFDLTTPVGAPDAPARYRKTLPRVAWVAFEYDGPAYQAMARRRALAPEPVWRGRVEPTRLVPVDTAPDFESLMRRYPAGHLIARAIILLNYLGPSDGGPLVYGVVRELVPSRVAVPRQWREPLFGLPPHSATGAEGPHTPHPPRFTAEIATGPLGVFYLRSVRPH